MYTNLETSYNESDYQMNTLVQNRDVIIKSPNALKRQK